MPTGTKLIRAEGGVIVVTGLQLQTHLFKFKHLQTADVIHRAFRLVVIRKVLKVTCTQNNNNNNNNKQKKQMHPIHFLFMVIMCWTFGVGPFSLLQLYFSTKGKEMLYLTMHSTHFIYGYMASDIW